MSTGKKSKPSYIYAIIGVSIVLFLLGVLGIIVINGRTLTRAFKENVTITTDFHDNTRDEKIAQFQAIVEKQPFTKHIKVISKQEALKIANEMEGDSVDSLTGVNPLYASLELNVHSEYVNKDSLDKVREFLLQSNIVREVTYPKQQVSQLINNFRKINIILGIIALILVVAVVILIDNTVRLAMFSNRFLIKTMQMVGANQKFITRPFDIRAVINGLVSGAISIVFLYILLIFAESYLPDLRQLHDTGMLAGLMLAMILLGIIISFFSTHRSVVKYLKMHVDDLY